VYVLFFAVTGANLHLDILLVVGAPAAFLVLVRGFGLWAGTHVGARLAGAPPAVGRYAGFGLLPQAGLALALALLFAKTFPEFGEGAAALTLGVVALNELVAPVLYRSALVRSGEAGRLAAPDFPEAAAVSRAHSFEFDRGKNPYFDLFFKGFIGGHLDRICFISEKMKDYYKEHILPGDNHIVMRLGTEKRFPERNLPSSDGVLRILSCSRAEPVKRLTLIAAALRLWRGENIEWTHIGWGSEFDQLETLSQEPGNPAVSIRLPGAFSNEAVHDYYRDHP
jgi:hypothetical protein